MERDIEIGTPDNVVGINFFNLFIYLLLFLNTHVNNLKLRTILIKGNNII